MCIHSDGGDLWVAKAAHAKEREEGRDGNLRAALKCMLGIDICVCVYIYTYVCVYTSLMYVAYVWTHVYMRMRGNEGKLAIEN